MIDLILVSDMKNKGVKEKVLGTIMNTDTRRMLIIDGAGPEPPRGGSAAKAYDEAGIAWAVCDPLDEFLPDLSGFDGIHFSGGDPFRLLLGCLRENVEDAIRTRTERRDFIIVGSSAGAMILAEEVGHADIMCDASLLPHTKGFGLIPGRLMPHYDQNGKGGDAMRERVAQQPDEHWTTIGERDVVLMSHENRQHEFSL